MTGEIIEVYNRLTFRSISVTKDGRQHVLKPGKNWINSDLLRFARQQNPMPGTRDPYTLVYESLIGIPGKHPISDVDEETWNILNTAGEVLDRTKLPPDRQTNVHQQHVPGPDPRKRVGMEMPSVGMTDGSNARPD